MKRAPLVAILLMALGTPGTDQCHADGLPKGPYFGQAPEGAVAEVFAPGIISLVDRYEYSVAFSHDLTECVFGITDSSWATFTLLHTSMSADSSWSDPVTAPFLDGGDGLNPAFSHDGERMFFASSRPRYPPANLWQATRNSDGGWTGPVMLPAPVSTSVDEFAPSLTAAGVLYFVSGREGGRGSADIYRAVPVEGVFASAENLGATINSTHLDSTPFIAPDESYLIFESDRPGGFGQQDLYISYRRNDTWSTPKNLGAGINTNQIEDEPYVSPDGKHLFFNRRRAFVTSQHTDLHWVAIGAVLDSAAVK